MALGEPSLCVVITCDTELVPAGTNCSIYSVSLSPGPLGGAKVAIREGSGGDLKVQLNCPIANGGAQWVTGNGNCGARSDGLYVDISGTGAVCTVEYTVI